MQIIIRDERHIKNTIRAYKNKNIAFLQNFGLEARHFDTAQMFSSLREAIIAPPIDEREQKYAVNCYTFLAQHMSGVPYVKRIYSSDETNHSALKHQTVLDNALSEIIRFYISGEIRGDLVIHKTDARNTNYERAHWPIVRRRRTKSECWFITGHTEWLKALQSFANFPSIGNVDLTRAQQSRRAWLNCAGKLSKYLTSVVLDGNELAIIYKRAFWVYLLRKNYNTILWRTMIEHNSPRAGVCYYLDGRAYWFQAGENQITFDIKRASSKECEIFPLVPLINGAQKDDPDFVKKYVCHLYKDDETALEQFNRYVYDRDLEPEVLG